MQERSTTRKRSVRNNKIWQAHLNGWRKSGLNRAEYCRRNNISYHALRYWQKKCERPSSSEITFVPVPFTGTVQNDVGRKRISELKVEFGNRFKIDVADDFSSATLTRLISTLEGC